MNIWYYLNCCLLNRGSVFLLYEADAVDKSLRPRATLNHEAVHKFKNSPKWDLCKPYRHVIKTIFRLTGGRTVRHLSLRNALEMWSTSTGAGWDRETLDAAAYSLRCMMSQLVNHKRNSRKIPRPQQQFFQAWP